MGVYTKIASQGGHDDLYAMGEGHDRKTLFTLTFPRRSDGGTGEVIGPPLKHWVIGMVPADEVVSTVRGVEELTVESIGPAIVGPLLEKDSCGNHMHAHTVEGWKFLDEVKAAEDDQAKQGGEEVVRTEYARRAIDVSCVGATS
eukprot:1169907-Prymnesium_polylepis.1